MSLTKFAITALVTINVAAMDLTSNQHGVLFAEAEHADNFGGPGSNLHCVCPDNIPKGLGQEINQETCQPEFTVASCASVSASVPNCASPKRANVDTCLCDCPASQCSGNWVQRSSDCQCECPATSPVPCDPNTTWSRSACSCVPNCPAPKYWNGSACVCGGSAPGDGYTQDPATCNWSCVEEGSSIAVNLLPAQAAANVTHKWKLNGVCGWTGICPPGQVAKGGVCDCDGVGKPGKDWKQNKAKFCAWECDAVPDAVTGTPNPGLALGKGADWKWRQATCEWECDPDCPAKYPQLVNGSKKDGFPWPPGWVKKWDRANNTCDCQCVAPIAPTNSGCPYGHSWKAGKCGCHCDIVEDTGDGKLGAYATTQRVCRKWKATSTLDYENCNCGCEAPPSGFKCPNGWVTWDTSTCSCCPWGLVKKCLDGGKKADHNNCSCV